MVRGSRWVDYDTHELLELISELEDERRWARLREGFWLAILVHLALLSALTWIPKYVFKVPLVVDPNDAIKQHKDFTYLDTPPSCCAPKVDDQAGSDEAAADRQEDAGGDEHGPRPPPPAPSSPRPAAGPAAARAAHSAQPAVAG